MSFMKDLEYYQNLFDNNPDPDQALRETLEAAMKNDDLHILIEEKTLSNLMINKNQENELLVVDQSDGFEFDLVELDPDLFNIVIPIL